MFGKRRRSKPEGINGIRNQDLKDQLRLRKERTSGRIFEIIRAEDREANSRVFCQDLKNERKNVVEEQASSEMEKETALRIRAMDVGALTTLGTFTRTRPEEDDGDKPGATGNLSGSHSG
jgi:hypothetical protein